MSEVYQPAIIHELLRRGGTASSDDLARCLARYDESAIEYYKKILARYPRETLRKHGIVEYDAKTKQYTLLAALKPTEAARAMEFCREKITEWIDSRADPHTGRPSQSKRLEILKAAHRKCQACGIPGELRYLDLDHIVPRSKADRRDRVTLQGGRKVHVDSPDNLQALCYTCNRSKRDRDQTDFRRTKKLVRDRVSDAIRAEGRDPVTRTLTGTRLATALRDKLIEEVGEYLDDHDPRELEDILEVVFALGHSHGVDRAGLLARAESKRKSHGGFRKGVYYVGDR